MCHLATRQPVRERPRRTEPAQHRGSGQRGERPERAQPEAGEQVDELAPTTVRRVDRIGEHRHRPRREERGRLAGRDHPRPEPAFLGAPRREPGRERARGHADTRVGDAEPPHQPGDPRRHRVVAPEVARRAPRGERQPTGTFEDQPRHQLLDHAHHELEGARVGRVVGVEHHQTGAARLGFPAAQPDRDSLGARLGRCAPYHEAPRSPLGHHHRHPRQARVAPARRDHRPVRAPQRAGPRRLRGRLRSHPVLPGPGELAGAGPGRRAPTLHPHLEPAPGKEAGVATQAVPHAARRVHRVRGTGGPHRPPPRRFEAFGDDQHRLPLAGAGHQASGVAQAHPAGHLGDHQAHPFEQRGDDGGPAGGGNPPDHREPFEGDPRLARGQRAQRAVEVDGRRPLPRAVNAAASS